MDWIKTFIEDEKFKDKKEIVNLEREKFYGNIQLNFFEGKVVNVNKNQTLK
ncbi:hypothetical protein LCGC14_1044190 [marine sediment metagenome]|uniref:Uncharacterized protein n=1 Tax=marine sediment metagenome TaxID=412755 RepID=A0A0F9QX20_9ZZZZ